MTSTATAGSIPYGSTTGRVRRLSGTWAAHKAIISCGGIRLSSTYLLGWTLVGTADFNSDSKPDLLWQNDEARQVVVR